MFYDKAPISRSGLGPGKKVLMLSAWDKNKESSFPQHQLARLNVHLMGLESVAGSNLCQHFM